MLYIETPAGTGSATSIYFKFHLVVENKGPETSVIRKFDLEVEGMPGTYENLQPIRRNSIQTRTGQMMLQFDSMLAGSSLAVLAHNVWSGMLGLQLAHCPPTLARFVAR